MLLGDNRHPLSQRFLVPDLTQHFDGCQALVQIIAGETSQATHRFALCYPFP